jgi:hypothetical protein
MRDTPNDDDPHDDMFGDTVDPEHVNEAGWVEAGWMRRGQPVAFNRAASGGSSAPVEPRLGGSDPPSEPRFSVDWIDGGRIASYPPDVAYPNGVAIDVALDAARACRVELACPAAGVGLWLVVCRGCGFAIALSTAGRADDPRSVRVPCRAR